MVTMSAFGIGSPNKTMLAPACACTLVAFITHVPGPQGMSLLSKVKLTLAARLDDWPAALLRVIGIGPSGNGA